MENEHKCCCECHKTTERLDDEKKKLINRLNRIEGQIRGIRKMIENDAYCVDVLTQASAAGSALNSFSKDVLTRHLKTCVVRDIKADDETAVEELAELVKKLMK